MKIWIALILGLLQGLTEFLPMSSSGHLILLENFLNVPQSMFFNLLLHFGTLIAVVVFYWKDVVWCIKHPLSKYSLCLCLATFCTATIAFALSLIPGVLDGIALGPCFVATGVLLVATELISKKLKYVPPKSMNATRAFVVGAVQGLAVMPGLSRSGCTISALRLSGMDSKSASSFSFLLSIPIIVGGIILEIAKGSTTGFDVGVWPCVIGFVVSFVVGLLSLFLLKKIIKNNKWWVFGPYMIAVGIAICLWQYAF